MIRSGRGLYSSRVSRLGYIELYQDHPCVTMVESFVYGVAFKSIDVYSCASINICFFCSIRYWVYSRAQHSISTNHFCNVRLDLWKKLPSRMVFLPLHCKHLQLTPSCTSFLDRSTIATLHLNLHIKSLCNVNCSCSTLHTAYSVPGGLWL